MARPFLFRGLPSPWPDRPGPARSSPKKKKKRSLVVNLGESPVIHLDGGSSSRSHVETSTDGVDPPLHNAQSKKRKAGPKKSPDITFEEPKKLEQGEGLGLGLSPPTYELEAKLLDKQAFIALLDTSALAGKFHADPAASVDPSVSIP